MLLCDSIAWLTCVILRQYNLVGRKFNCDRMWRAENLVAPRYDSCAHPDTVQSYRILWHSCHTYVNEVVAMYDKLEADEPNDKNDDI